MNEHDDTRDVRAALGGLLVDEPAAPWSVSDDVARGRALQRRRRTAALGGIGLVAALALVAGVLGPWSPTATTPPAASGADLEQSVTEALAGLGWETDAVARVADAEPGSPQVRVWTVHRALTDPGVQAKLQVRTWDAASFPEGPAPDGRLIIGCSGAGACGMVDAFSTDCAAGPCWTRASTVVQKQFDTLPIGSAIVSAWSLSPRAAVELAATPVAATGSSPDPLATAAFLSQTEQQQLLGVVQSVLLEQSTVRPTPAPEGDDCAASDVAITPSVDVVPAPFGRVMLVMNVVPIEGGVSCVLRGRPAVQALSTSGDVLGFDVVGGADGVDVRIGGDADAAFRVAYDVCAPVGGDVASLRVTLPDDGASIDVDVAALQPLVSCSGLDAGTDMTVSGFEPASVDEPRTTTACTPDDVKLIPATGQPSEATGSRGIWIEVHARNPEVDCLATKPESVTLEDAQGGALALRYAEGVYQGQDFDVTGLSVTQRSGPARFALTKYRCDESPVASAFTAYVTLEGWDRAVPVQLPPGAGIDECPGGPAAPGNTLYVSHLEGSRA